MAKDDYKFIDLQKCNKALGTKWLILKKAMIEISEGKGMPEMIAKKALEEQAEIGMPNNE